MYRPRRNAALFLGAVLAPIALVLFIGFGPFGCKRGPLDRGGWEPTPEPFTPEPPSGHAVFDPWDASIPPPPVPGSRPFLLDPNARKPSEVVGDLRFYCPFPVRALAVSPDGKLLACSDGGRFVALFDTATGLEVGKLYTTESSGRGFGQLAFSPDSKRLYSDRYIWDIAAHRGLARLPYPEDWGLSGDGKTLATLEQVGVKWVGSGPVPTVYVARPVVRLRDTETWKVIDSFAAPANLSLALSPDGQHVAIGGNDGVVRVWDRTAKKELPPLTALAEKPPGEPAHIKPGVTRLFFSPDGTTLAGLRGGEGAPIDREIGLWKWPAGDLAHRLPLSESGLFTIAFTRDSHRIVLTSRGRSAVWDVSTGAVLGERLEKKGETGYGRAALTPDGRHLYTSGPDWRLQKVSIPDLHPVDLDPPVKPTELQFEMQKHFAPNEERVLPDGTVLRRGSPNESFGVLQLDVGGKRIRHFAEGDHVAFDVSNDGTLLATYGNNAGTGSPQVLTLKIWDIASGGLVESIRMESSRYSSRFRLSPDGKRVAMLAGGQVDLWDVASKDLVLTLSTDGYAIYELAFFREGRFLVGGHDKAPAVIWDLSEAK